MARRLLGFAWVTAACTAGMLLSPELLAQEAPKEVEPAGDARADAPAPDVDAQPKKKKKKKKKKSDEQPATQSTEQPAAEPPDQPSAPSSKGTVSAEPAGPRARPQKNRFGKLEVFGRVAVRAELERHERAVLDPDDELTLGRVDSLDLLVSEARLGVDYRAPAKWLSAEIEIDAADGLELLDAWAMAKSENFSTRAGKSKMPFSAIEMESSFTLPMARRGLVQDILVDELEVAGRRPGVTFGARYGKSVHPSLVLGVFQGSVLVKEERDDRDVEPFSERALDAQSLVARAEARVWDVELGVNYEHRVGTDHVLEPSHYWTFGVDAGLDTELDGYGVRAWAEVMDGASWFEHRLKPIDAFDAVFVTTRFITAFRFGGMRREELYVEPYAMMAVLDPDIDVSSDIVVEEAVGVNVGLWKRVRVGLEAEYQKAEPNFPERYFLGENGDRKALVLDAQIAF